MEETINWFDVILYGFVIYYIAVPVLCVLLLMVMVWVVERSERK